MMDAFDDLFQLQRRLQRMIRQDAEQLQSPSLGWLPETDIVETDEGFQLKVELPGVRKDDIEVIFDGKDLKIRGVKPPPPDTSQAKFHQLESEYGEFHRVFRFDTPVDTSNVDAVLSNGLLTISVMKVTA